MFTQKPEDQRHDSIVSMPSTKERMSGEFKAEPQDMDEMTGSETSTISVIGNDLTIKGEQITIVSKGILRIDGEILGDVQSVELIISEQARVIGTVTAETVSILGQVVGAIRGNRVKLYNSSHVEGDVHHHTLIVKEGAVFNGRSLRAQSATATQPSSSGSFQTPTAKAAE